MPRGNAERRESKAGSCNARYPVADSFLIWLAVGYSPPLEVRDADHNGTPLRWAIFGSENGWYCDTGDYGGTVEALAEQFDIHRTTVMRHLRRANVPKQHWTDFCISGSYFYLRFTLPPGPHTLRINGGCPQGTDVPSTIPVQVVFSVRRS